MPAPQAALDMIRPYQQQAPVDVVGIARALGLNVYSDNLPNGVSGQIVKRPQYGSPSGYSIIVNSNEAHVRQRFTVAHEIAHFILHCSSIGDGISESTLYRAAGLSSRQEVEANQLAAEILMPQNLLLLATQNGQYTARQMADTFNVSEVAMSIRLGLPT
jgi:Zn-dependent peptidase ImmA (M78 family)